MGSKYVQSQTKIGIALGIVKKMMSISYVDDYNSQCLAAPETNKQRAEQRGQTYLVDTRQVTVVVVVVLSLLGPR